MLNTNCLLAAFIAMGIAQSSMGSEPSSTPTAGVASDRATYVGETKIFHVPYVETVDDHKIYDLKFMLSDQTDADGNLLFSLSNDGIHELHTPHFTYEGDEGPEHWGELTTDYLSCAMGKNQSPIDLTGIESPLNGGIEFDYSSSALNILNNGHTVQVNYDAGSSITLDGTSEYQLLQYHFHTPSEHTIDGVSFPMEMHLVHADSNGSLAVVGVMIEAGAENAAFANMISHIPGSVTAVETIESVLVSIANALPSSNLEYRYSGSLTTPPCSEGVQWLVLENPIQMSDAQIASFEDVLDHNNRPIQNINARNVLKNK